MGHGQILCVQSFSPLIISLLHSRPLFCIHCAVFYMPCFIFLTPKPKTDDHEISAVVNGAILISPGIEQCTPGASRKKNQCNPQAHWNSIVQISPLQTQGHTMWMQNLPRQIWDSMQNKPVSKFARTKKTGLPPPPFLRLCSLKGCLLLHIFARFSMLRCWSFACVLPARVQNTH